MTPRLERLLLRREALEKRLDKLEEEATLTAMAECGPKRNDPAYQAAFDVSKERALQRGAEEIRAGLHAVNADIAQEKGIEKALTAGFNKAAKAHNPTAEKQADHDRD